MLPTILGQLFQYSVQKALGAFLVRYSMSTKILLADTVLLSLIGPKGPSVFWEMGLCRSGCCSACFELKDSPHLLKQCLEEMLQLRSYLLYSPLLQFRDYFWSN